MPGGVNKNNVGLEIPQFRILERNVLGVAVVSRFVERRFDSLRQEKQLQHALHFGGRGAAENRNPRWDEIRLLKQFLLQRLAIPQDIRHRNRESERLQNLRLQGR